MGGFLGDPPRYQGLRRKLVAHLRAQGITDERVLADILTFHWEATSHPDRLVQEIHRLGKKAGIAINPATPVEVLRDILPEIELVCVMSVNPGFGGQKFIPYVARKGYRLSRLRAEVGSRALLEVDGGISLETVEQVPWADVLVAGQIGRAHV